MFWRSKADAVEESVQPEPPTSETAAADVVPPAPEPEVIVEVTAVHDTPEEPPAMPQQLSEADVEAVKQEIVQEMLEKLQEVEGAIVPEVVTAPYDPRFPTTNQNRHCFVRYSEYYKCKFERGEEDKRCLFYQRAYKSICPEHWLEEWEELREQGLWFGKY